MTTVAASSTAVVDQITQDTLTVNGALQITANGTTAGTTCSTPEISRVPPTVDGESGSHRQRPDRQLQRLLKPVPDN